MDNQIKPNCYECKHRRAIPGNAHSSCAHPFLADLAKANPNFELARLVGLPVPMTIEFEGKRIPLTLFSEYAVQSGWAAWPFNFDPVWLQFCLFWNIDKAEAKLAKEKENQNGK